MTYKKSETDSRHPDTGVSVYADSLGVDAYLHGYKVLYDVSHEVARDLAYRILEVTEGGEEE